MQIELTSHDPRWAAAFENLRDAIVSALGVSATSIEHVGSTAVAALAAKPVLDILLVVDDSSNEVAYRGALEGVGFTFHAREPDWYEHRLFKHDDPQANLHVFSVGCPEIDRMVAFRDLLRRDESARAAYDAKKRELAGRTWDRVQDYADAKSGTVEALLKAYAGRGI